MLRLTCLDALGKIVMPYPEYVLALFTYLFEVKGRYKRCMDITCDDGVHRYGFYVDGAHNYGVSLDECKEMITFKVKMPDYTELAVTDYCGYDTIRLLYVDNLDCFSADVLGQLRFISSLSNCECALAYSYMGALRLVSEPMRDLFAETLAAISHHLLTFRVRDLSQSIFYNGLSVRRLGDRSVYFAPAMADTLERGRYL